MLFNVYTKDIATGKVNSLPKTIELTGKPSDYKSHLAVAEAITLKIGQAYAVKTVASLNSGKCDLCFEVNGKANANTRYMCYLIAEVPVTQRVPLTRIADMLVGAVEGGSNYWAQRVQYIGADERGKVNGSIWYAMGELLTQKEIFTIKYDDPAKDEGNGKGAKTIGYDDICAGLSLMAEQSPRHLADLLNETDDATTADVFLQYVVLKDVIYG